MIPTRSLLCIATLCWPASSLRAQSPSADQTAIRAARSSSNRAIAVHDVSAAAAIWSTDYVGVSSNNVRTIGRDAEREHVANLFATRHDAMYVRTPGSVTVNAGWGQAAESGTWTGQWSGADGVTHIGGVYFAKWRKEQDGEWRILAETFVQTTCSGTPYCTAPPSRK